MPVTHIRLKWSSVASLPHSLQHFIGSCSRDVDDRAGSPNNLVVCGVPTAGDAAVLFVFAAPENWLPSGKPREAASPDLTVELGSRVRWTLVCAVVFEEQ